MKALVVTPTYNRIPFLGRALASFLSQDWDDKHMVFVNDDKHVKLCCDHKSVTCINLNNKIDLPHKRNIGSNLGHYDIIFPHDDDDVFLPDRISHHISKYEKDVKAYKNNAGYMIHGTTFDACDITTPNDLSYRRQTWFEVGGYQHHQTCGDDQEFFFKLKGLRLEDDKDHRNFVYNWGGLNYHATFTSKSDMMKMSYEYLKANDLLDREYWIEPDFDQYSKFVTMDDQYKKNKSPIQVNHIALSKIEICS
jgi:glycosyltransferase involved in cell wall biosynthesis